MAHKKFGQKSRLAPDSPDPISFSRRDMLRMGGIALPAATLIQSWLPALSQVVGSFDYYISPNGNDSNPGTVSQPWAITAINTKQAIYAGKKVGLLDGTYNVYSMYAGGANDGYTPLLQIKGGTAGSPTVIQSVNARQAIIQANNGAAYGNNTPVMGCLDSSNGYITVDGIKLTGHSTKGFYFGSYGLASTGVTYPGLTVQNCEFTNQSAIGQTYGNNLSSLEMAGAVGNLVNNNYFHNNTGYSANSSDHFSAWIVWFNVGGTFQYNTLISSGNMYGKEIGNYGNTIQYNYVDSSNQILDGYIDAGITDYGDNRDVNHGVSQSWHHNVIKASKGIDFRQDASGPTSNTINVYNNTLIINASAQSGGIIGAIAPSLYSCYNNIIYSAASGDHFLNGVNLDYAGLLDYNLYYDSASSYIWNTFANKNSHDPSAGKRIHLLENCYLWRLARYFG